MPQAFVHTSQIELLSPTVLDYNATLSQRRIPDNPTLIYLGIGIHQTASKLFCRPAIRLKMGKTNSKNERERYYLLPGMGGRAYRKKVKIMIGWGLLGGVVASLLVALILYLISRMGDGAV